jgi:hypothetical protein
MMWAMKTIRLGFFFAALVHALPQLAPNNGQPGIEPALFEQIKYAEQLSLSAFDKGCKTPLGGTKVFTIKGSATGYIAVDNAKKNINVVMRGTSRLLPTCLI